MKCSLVDHAAQLIWDSGNTTEISFDELVEKLRRRYGSLDQQEKFQAELRARRRRNGESLAELSQDIRRIMTRAYPGQGTSPLCGQIAKEYFLAALGDKDLELRIREREPQDLESASKHAVRLEALLKAVDNSGNRDDDRGGRNRRYKDDPLARRVTELERRVTVPNETSPQPSGQIDEVNRLKVRMEEMNKELERLRAVQTAREMTMLPERSQHAQSLPVTTTAQTDTRQNSNRNITCYNCGGQGHISRQCLEQRRPRRAVTTTSSAQPPGYISTPAETVPNDAVVNAARRNEVGTLHSDVERKIYLQLFINGSLYKCLVDSGSDLTIIPSAVVAGLSVEPCQQRLLAANGTPIRVTGQINVQAHMEGHYFWLSGLVSDHVAEVMLGNDFLFQHDTLWRFRTGELVIDGVVHRLCSKSTSPWCRRVILQSDCAVPARAEAILPTKVVYNDLMNRVPSQKHWITEAHTMRCGLQVSRSTIPDDDVNVPVRVMNTKTEDINLKAGTVISNLEPVDVCENPQGEAEDNDPHLDVLLKEMVARVDESVSAEDRKHLLSLLREFRTAFSSGENDLGRTTLATHCIETTECRPVRQPLRRHPPAHLTAIEQHVEGMLQQGIIEPSKSPWASNIVLVRKKDQTLRCCIDFRQLNDVTRKDAYPLPRTDMCLDAMAGSSWFSTFDLRSSYHQVPMDPRDADKTAFICHRGQYRFLTMPFGLCNAGATFQRLMDIVMSGLSYEICLAYLDDVIIFAASLDEQFRRLRTVLSRLQQAGLKLKPSKCSLLQTSVVFLGHVVYAGAISVDPQKVRC